MLNFSILLLNLLVGVGANASSPSKLACTARELRRKDCRLYAGGYNIRLLTETVAWSDGTWHTVDPMPMSKDTVEWQKIEFTFLARHPVLQFWLWDKGVGESQIQSLHWYVADAEKRKFTVLAEGIVRKRHQEKIELSGTPPAENKPKYLFDKWENHGIKALKNGDLEWKLGSERKILELRSSFP